MAFWTDKAGNKLTFSEFKERWKQGIAKVSQLQQVNASINFTWLTLVGLLCGIVVSAWQFNTLWWLTIILVAAFGNTGVGMLGLWQKRIMLLNIEKQMKEIQGGELNGLG